MTMLLGPPSEAALRDTFERVLAGILDGSYECAPECNGLDEEVRAALNAVAVATSRRLTNCGARAALGCRGVAPKILSARTEFVRQLDGTQPRAEPCPTGGGAKAAHAKASRTVAIPG
jgi:hypothetical protein